MQVAVRSPATSSLALCLAIAFATLTFGQKARPDFDPESGPRIDTRDTCHLIVLGGLGDAVRFVLETGANLAALPWRLLGHNGPKVTTRRNGMQPASESRWQKTAEAYSSGRTQIDR